MKATIDNEFKTSTVARVAAEDLKPGDFVTVSSEMIELPSFLWSCTHTLLPADEAVRMRFMSREAGRPFKVFAICLPFVYVKSPQGEQVIFDIRKHELVRLDRSNGRKVWKEMRSALNRAARTCSD